MDNSNIIISVIIVLCIAAGVTAYGISEGDNAVFSDLTGFSPDSSNSGDNGIGNITANNSDGSGSSPTTTASSGSSGGSSGGASSGTGTSSGSNSRGGSGNGGSSGNGGGSGGQGGTTPSKITPSQASSIASGFIGEEGAYVGAVTDSGSNYICKIYDANGNWVDSIIISYSGENLGRG